MVQEEETEEHVLHMVNSSTSIPPIKISVVLDGTPAEMELDTGAAYSVMAENKFRE